MPHKDLQERSRYFKNWYQQNKEKEIKRAKKNKKAIRDLIVKEKSKPCADCKVEYPFYVMEFDHAQGKKILNLASAHLRRGRLSVLKEIAKCDIVCSNCHKARTWKRYHKISFYRNKNGVVA